jgi:hypothetical protein
MPGTYNSPKTKFELLERWLKRARESQFAHYEAADRLKKLNYWFGVPVVAITSIVGTSVFASLNSTEGLNDNTRIAVGAISVMAAVLASLQTFLDFSEQAGKHRITGARYGIARRALEDLVAGGADSVSQDQMDQIRKEIDGLAVEAPNISKRVLERAMKKQAQESI